MLENVPEMSRFVHNSNTFSLLSQRKEVSKYSHKNLESESLDLFTSKHKLHYVC